MAQAATPLLVLNLPKPSGRKVLVKTPPKGHIHDLDAPADPESREALFCNVASQEELQAIPLRVDLPQGGIGFLPVKGEVQVCMGRALPQSVRVLGRDEDRREPRLGKGLEVGRPQAPTLSPKLGSDAKERTPSYPRDS